MLTVTQAQARRFLLRRQGLLGEYRFAGRDGVADYVRQAGCIQFDPVDACGKNAELVLQARVKGFTKEMLWDVLYRRRALVDYPDKNQSIMPVEDLPYFARFRRAARVCGEQFEQLPPLEQKAKAYIAQNGPVCAEELPIEGKIRWHSAIHWSGNWHGEAEAARSVLEQLYSTGELVIHHKQGARKYYDLAERHIDSAILTAADPLPGEAEHIAWRVRRRIGAVGMLWNRPSDAWLNIWELDSEKRNRAFESLEREGQILPVQVEGIRGSLYIPAEDAPLLEEVKTARYKPRWELIAPLDCLMWDRKLIKALFGFEYSWEIYTPAEKRKYGHYVLPLLYGESFAGRVEALAEHKTQTLRVKNIWPEEGFSFTAARRKSLEARLRRFAKFNNCTHTVLPE